MDRGLMELIGVVEMALASGQAVRVDVLIAQGIVQHAEPWTALPGGYNRRRRREGGLLPVADARKG